MAVPGCLVGYGPDYTELGRRIAAYVARIFHGDAAAELPIEGPTHFEFAVNLKTAKALGLTVPQSILARADEVIESRIRQMIRRFSARWGRFPYKIQRLTDD